MATGPSQKSSRVVGVDVARALASVIMIQGHAYDGWVSPESKETVAYAITRFFGTLPLPAFLVLAGAAVALRVHAAIEKNEDPRRAQRQVIKRGLEVALYGYGVSFLYALMDGGLNIENVLRADVLQAIGFSLVLFAVFAIGGTAQVSKQRFALGAIGLGLGSAIICPWLSTLTLPIEGPTRFLVAPFSDVAGITLMPAIPLVSWTCAGALLGQAMILAQAGSKERSRRGAPRAWLIRAGLISIGLSLVSHFATQHFIDAGTELTRQHPIVWLNIIDLGARGALVLIAGVLVSDLLQGRALGVSLSLGRGSLLAYVLHIPFCYGVLGSGLQNSLSMVESSLCVLLLIIACIVAVRVRDKARTRVRQWRRARR